MATYIMRQELTELYERWMDKARQYQCSAGRLEDCFDKFFTLFVAYNVLYTEVAYKLKGGRKFTDKAAATSYVKDYIRAGDFIAGIERDQNCVSALQAIVQLLDRGQQPHGPPQFHIVLDACSGQPDEGKDEKLLRDLTGGGKGEKTGAILKLIYNIRCNMFHGRKSLHGQQVPLLQAVTALLERVVALLFEKLSGEAPRLRQA